MKKIIGSVVLIVLMTVAVACSPQKASSSSGAYKDGTYKAEGDKWDFGFEDATVIVKDGEIQEISLRRLDKEGKEVDYKAYHEMGGPDLTEARTELSEAMLKKQTFEVDSFSSATISSGNWRTAVNRALEKAAN